MLRNSIISLYKSLTGTAAIEKALESYLCPLQMFFELTSNGLSAGAFKILKHDLNVKRIFLTKLTINYFNGIYTNIKTITGSPAQSGSESAGQSHQKMVNDIGKSHDMSKEEMSLSENLLSIPLFITGVVYAIALNVRRTIIRYVSPGK
ncbi:MAG: hypothetical protein H7844_07820 [Nitrospirae bacterium YQR-1]